MKREIFNNLSRRSASLQEPQISQKFLRKSDPAPPQILEKHFAKLWAGANYSVTLTLDTSGLSARGSCTRAASQRPARAWCQEALLGATALVSAHASRIRTTPMRVRGPT